LRQRVGIHPTAAIGTRDVSRSFRTIFPIPEGSTIAALADVRCFL